MSIEESLRRELLFRRNEIEELRERLAEAEKTLEALRSKEPHAAKGSEASDASGKMENKVLEIMLEHIPAGIVIENAATGRITFESRHAAEIWRRASPTPYEKIRYSAYEGFHPDGRPYKPEEWPLARSLLAGEIVIDEEIRFRREDGALGEMSASSRPILDSNGQIVSAIMIFFDITARKLMEEALRRSEEECRLTFDGAPIGGAIVGLDNRFEIVNDAMSCITGYSKAELTSLYIKDITHPDDIESENPFIAKLHAGEIDHYQHEKRYIRKDGDIVWANVHIRLQREVNGRPLYYLKMVEDISERKAAEEALRKAHDELEQRVQERTAELSIANEDLKSYAARLQFANKELQELAFVATHHLQEPLRKLQVFGSLIKSRHSASIDEPASEYLTRMINSAGRMQQLIQDLLRYSRVAMEPEPFHSIPLGIPAMEALNELSFRVQETEGSVEISELPHAEASARQMRQLFHHLISNALKYRSSEKPFIRIYGEECADGTCRVFVEDNGMGFEEIYLDRIFRPFQRLHGNRAYSGTGMGLAICRKIVEHHFGHITVRSSPGKGSTFIVTLPIRQRKEELHAQLPQAGDEEDTQWAIPFKR